MLCLAQLDSFTCPYGHRSRICCQMKGENHTGQATAAASTDKIPAKLVITSLLIPLDIFFSILLPISMSEDFDAINNGSKLPLPFALILQFSYDFPLLKFLLFLSFSLSCFFQLASIHHSGFLQVYSFPLWFIPLLLAFVILLCLH